MSFDQKTRNLLQRTVSACRKILDEEFAAQRRKTYGINDDGSVAPLELLGHLPDEDLQTARLLRDRLDHLAAGLTTQGKKESDARKEAVGRLTREQAFTVLNRLAALRMAEEREIVLECVRNGLHSEGFLLFQQTAGSAFGETWLAYRAYLLVLFDELAIDLGVLFSRWDPAGLLFPGKDALEAVLQELGGTGTAMAREDITPEEFNAIWSEDETIGWIYQYYNDPAERKKMREESSAPRNSRELAVRNQFFTPRYVVEFLTDNTLGRIWYEMTRGETRLKEQCRYLVRRPSEVFLAEGESTPEVVSGQRSVASEEKETEHRPQSTDHLSQEELLRQPVFIPHRPLKDPRTILMLDPACGSMHFGLYAFDLFEVIYEEAWDLQLSVVGGQWSEDIHEQAKILSRITGLAEGYGPGGSDLPGDKGLSKGGDLRADQPDPASGGVGAVEHRGGTGPELDPAVSPSPIDRLRVTDGDGDADTDRSAPRVSESGNVGRDYRTNIRNRENVEWLVRRALEKNDWTLTTDHQPLILDFPTKAELLKNIPKLIIEHNLHGIDIDPRAVQIAGLALWLRAQKAWQRLGLAPAARPAIKRSNIVCAEPMPGEKELLREFVEREFPEAERGVCLRLLEAIFDKMQLAGEAGSLLKIEEEIRSAIEEARDAWQKLATRPPELFTTTEMSGARGQWSVAGGQNPEPLTTDHQSLTTDFWERIEERIYAALRDYAEQAENGGGFQRRLFAEDAARGFAFIDVCRKRYDVALMNPPFGLPTPTVEEFAKERFEHTWQDIYGCFFERTLELTKPSFGYVGAITPKSFYHAKGFRGLRDLIQKQATLTYSVDIGGGVLDAAVEVCFSVLGSRTSRIGGKVALFCNLVSAEKEMLAEHVAGFVDMVCSGLSSDRIVPVTVDENAGLPNEMLPYRFPADLLQLLRTSPSFESGYGNSVVGITTFDNDRFIRARWETDAAARQENEWIPVAMGGGWDPFFSEFNLVARWRNEAAEMRANELRRYATTARTMQSQKFWFKPGLTFSKISTLGFSVQPFPAKSVFTSVGFCIFSDKLDLWTWLGYFNSKPVCCLMSLFSADRHWHSNSVAFLPVPPTLNPAVGALAKEAFLICAEFGRASETAPEFLQCELPRSLQNLSTAYVEVTGALAKEVSEAFALLPATLDFLSQNAIYAERDFLISDLEFANKRLSYALGVAFGRWDIRYATGEQVAPELPDPFAPLPVCPPGQLQNAQGLPARPEDLPAAYPVRIPWDGILVDDPNHPLDLERRVREVIGIVFSGQCSVASGDAATDHRPPTTPHARQRLRPKPAKSSV
jgi:hypothetical protein